MVNEVYGQTSWLKRVCIVSTFKGENTKKRVYQQFEETTQALVFDPRHSLWTGKPSLLHS